MIPKLPPGYLELLMRKRYSQSTISTYSNYFLQFMDYFLNEELQDLSHQQNQRINAIKFYFEQVLGRKREYFQISRPRKESKLPTVLTLDEVEKILRLTVNQKHKCILMALYSAGLRRSELINMKIEDIDSKRMLIKVCGAKGKKDRYTLLSEHLLEQGINLRYIQELLGHASTKTTEVYTRVASNALMKIKNPLETIFT